MQNIKPAEMTKLVEFGLSLAASRQNDTQNNPRQHVLVVDDDKDSRQHSLEVLTRSGYEVAGAIDGAAGWEALQTFDYDLVVTDNLMPRMTGVEMIAKLRASSMNVPVIMATGQLPVFEFARRPWLKPDVALQRPFTNDDLLAAVKRILGPGAGRQSSDEPPPQTNL